MLHAARAALVQVWKIEDFLAKWTKATEGKGQDDPIALILLKEIDSYRRCLPHLKTTMRGAGWEDSHWLQVRWLHAVPPMPLRAPPLLTEPLHGSARGSCTLAVADAPSVAAVPTHWAQDVRGDGRQQGDRHAGALPRRRRRGGEALCAWAIVLG